MYTKAQAKNSHHVLRRSRDEDYGHNAISRYFDKIDEANEKRKTTIAQRKAVTLPKLSWT